MLLQAASSKYEAEFDADSGVILDPPSGIISSSGKATIHFSRGKEDAGLSSVRLLCKVGTETVGDEAVG